MDENPSATTGFLHSEYSRLNRFFRDDLFFSVYCWINGLSAVDHPHDCPCCSVSHPRGTISSPCCLMVCLNHCNARSADYFVDEGVSIRKVRGVNEENDALSRLADAICGFVRAGLEGKAPYAAMLEDALRQGVHCPGRAEIKNPLG